MSHVATSDQIGVREAARILGCHMNTVYSLQKNGKLDVQKRSGRQIYFKRQDVLSLVGKWRSREETNAPRPFDYEEDRKVVVHSNGLTSHAGREEPASSAAIAHAPSLRDTEEAPQILYNPNLEVTPQAEAETETDPMQQITQAVSKMAEQRMQKAKAELLDAVETLELYLLDVTEKLQKLKETL